VKITYTNLNPLAHKINKFKFCDKNLQV